MKIIITIEQNDDEGIEVVFGHSAEEAEQIQIMPVILSLMGFEEHNMKLADRCLRFHYPYLNMLSAQEQDRIINDYHERVTLANLHEPGTYKTLKIIMP